MVYHQTLGYQKIPFWDRGFIVDDSLSVNALFSLSLNFMMVFVFFGGTSVHIFVLLRFKLNHFWSLSYEKSWHNHASPLEIIILVDGCNVEKSGCTPAGIQGIIFFIIKHCHQFNFKTKKNLTGYLVVVVYFDKIRQKIQEWWACKLVDTLHNRSWE